MDVGLRSETYVGTQVSHTGIHNSEIYQTTSKNLNDVFYVYMSVCFIFNLKHMSVLKNNFIYE